MDYEKLHKDTLEGLKTLVSEGKITEEVARKICSDFKVESEDERIRKEIIEIVRTSPIPENHNELLAYLEKQKEQKPAEGDNETEIQKAFREGKSAGRKEVFDHPEEYGLQEEQQEPAEWSEEDKLYLKNAIFAVKNKWGADSPTADWLDSLPERFNPQPHWKPSKEQMDALKESSTSWMNEYMENCEHLKSLYNDLKKL